MRRAKGSEHADDVEAASAGSTDASRPWAAPRAAARTRWAWLLLLVGLLVVAANVVATWRSPLLPQLRTAMEGEKAGLAATKDEREDLEWVLKDSEALAEQFTAQQRDEMERQLVYSLYVASQQTSVPRGILLPLFDGIATLGVSLIMELRAMNIALPIEIAHCGDLDARYRRKLGEQRDLGEIYFVDVCERARKATSVVPGKSNRNLFCRSERECHGRFRNFDIKLLAVVFSRFEEFMLLDADVIFFQDPMALWDTDKYKETGTLFFHDRLSQDDMFLGLPMKNRPGVNELNNYISKFDVSPFRFLDRILRPGATVPNLIPVTLNHNASDHLLTTHAWNHRAGHEMDSSCVLWSKKRQPRSTAILAAFVALNDVRRPPSYGDKELFFIASELAETKYALSDYGVGGVGTDFRDHGEDKSIVCGQAAHYYPESSSPAGGSIMYLNSDDILKYEPRGKPVYYSKARPADFYAGSFTERNLPQECPFDVTGIKFSEAMNHRVALRQRFHEIAVEWQGQQPQL